MDCSHQVFRSLPKFVLASVALGFGSTDGRAAPGGHGGGGHGAGAGHVVPFHGGYGYGFHGYYGGYPHGFYGYPYGYYGFGPGFGVGYGFYGYGGYPYYGYPYSGGGYYGGGYFGNSYYDFGGGYPYYGNSFPYSGGGYPSYFPYGAISPSTSNPTASSGGPPLLTENLPSLQGPLPAGSGVVSAVPAVQSPDSEVALIVRVPTSATVWVNGAKTTQSGPRREFISTGLNPGRNYTFLVRAQWIGSNGKVEDHDRWITVQAGERRAVDFGPVPPTPSTVTPAPAPVTP